jgi:hypothetical protein
MYKSLIFLSILFITLDSYYFYDLGIALLSFFGLFLFIILNVTNFSLNNIKNKKIKYFLVYSLINIFISQIIGLMVISNYSYNAIIAFLANQSFMLIKYKDLVYRNIIIFFKCIIIIHIIAFYIQFSSYYFFDSILDYIYPITGEEQRYFDGSNLMFGKQIFRSTGLYIEPSTYGAHIICMLMISRELLSRRLELIALTSILLTFSTASAIYVVLYILLYFKNLFNSKVSFIIIIPLLIICLNYAINRVVDINPEVYDVVGIRLEILYKIFQELNLFGVGIGAITSDIKGGLNVYDTGVAASLTYYIGLVGAGLLFYAILMSCKRTRINLLILMFLKISFFHPFFWLSLSLLYYRSIYERHSNNNSNI